MKKILLILSSFILFAATVILMSVPLTSDSFYGDALCISAPGAPLKLPKLPSSEEFILRHSIASASISDSEDDSSPVPAEESYTPETEPLPPPSDIIETTIQKGSSSLFGIEINNETDYDLSSALKEVQRPSSPTVLIVHTHTSESYRPSDKFPYIPKDNSRTEDTCFNVARVGEELRSSLSAYGINVIHDSTVNDYPSYNGSYKKTLELIEAHLKKNPSIDIIIDLHRDAMERTDGTKISTVCTAENEKAAQVMLVVGTDRSGLNHPDWRDNFSFAVELQNIINENFPHLTRPLNVRNERFNGHISGKELIIEVGTTGNTLDEALVSARALAFAINEFYTG
ncbi:MAG: stage II sporulation protein P [Clostridia bacterium]|nr:stage II sporulation protein P [Clostridia bacterium]